MELPTRFEPEKAEKEIYQLWESSGCFDPDARMYAARDAGTRGKKKRAPFVIIMPPPNANGPLHIGHALFVALEDAMIRYKRMAGYRSLWLPGADHAGFETQAVFDKKLQKEGRNRFAIPRAQLYREMLEFTQKNKAVMENQLRALGASCDWSREVFTLDPKVIDIVYDTFIKLYNDGLAYRDLRVINWCPKHQTALSDLEVKYVERVDPLYYIQYGPLTLATVRPETKFGDTALAVHPKDARYKKYIGKEIRAQGLLGQLKFKVIADEAVDPSFGTGVVKVTPAHDAADFEIWQRHKNEIPGPKRIIDERGRLTGDVGPYKGMKVAEARLRAAEDMRKLGILEKIDPRYTHQVATCYKCGSTLEPLPKMQWFINVTNQPRIKAANKPRIAKKSLRDVAVDAVKSGKIKFVTKRFEKTFFHWMKNLRDWNISRQIVWGIRIPVWFCKNQTGTNPKSKILNSKQIPNSKFQTPNTQAFIVSKEKPKACPLCSACEMEQDPDVFDTWFSSGQWPFAALLASRGSKSKAKIQNSKVRKKSDFETFYPTDVMETGYDILFFWVARMIMLGIYATGKVPFKTVYLHGLVRDKDRQKMSKSKGNVVDPLGMVSLYGADAVRMALVAGTAPGNDPVISEDKIRGYRNFATKVWNIARFILMQYRPALIKTKPRFTPADKKALEQLRAMRAKTTKYIETYQFHRAAEIIYHYVWHTFADKIIEASKERLRSHAPREQAAAFQLLVALLVASLKSLHPFMPFVTEAIYQQLPAALKDAPLLMIAKW